MANGQLFNRYTCRLLLTALAIIVFHADV